MKKLLSLVLALALLVSCNSAMALNYTGRQGNEATFETLEEVRVSSPIAVQTLEQNETKAFISHPVLDGIAEGTVFVYRSANMYGGRAAGRMNTNLIVYVDQHFDDKDAAKAYLDSIGVIPLIDEAIGSILLVTPANGKSFGQADQMTYYKLQTMLNSQKGSTRTAEGSFSYAEPEYLAGFAFMYAIGFDGGASFLNNYVAPIYDYASRLAGMLLVNGAMDSIAKVSTQMPVYLVNASEQTIAKYAAVNAVEATDETAETVTYYNEQLPLQRVVVAKEAHDNAWYVNDAYRNLFTKAQRIPVGRAGIYSAGTAYQGVGNDKAPFSLCERVDISTGVTAGGIHMIKHVEDRFAEYTNDAGEYIQTWFEYLPEEVLDGTAAPASIPLVLGIHGTGDDPRQFVDEIGLLAVAEKERIAIISPEHNALGGLDVRIETKVLPALVTYMLETYPALDPARVYATGFSMGGGSTMKAILAAPELFAAAVPMSPVTFFGDVWIPDEEDINAFASIDLPVMLTTSGYDLMNTYDSAKEQILVPLQGLMNQMMLINEIPQVESFDFDAYPYCGFKADRVVTRTLNGEYTCRSWYLNKDGIPMTALSITEGLTHSLYPEYGWLFWDFVKDYARDTETGAVIYKGN